MGRLGRNAAAAVAVVFGAAAAAAGCSQPTDEQPYAGHCAPFAVVAWSPPGRSQDVPTNSDVSLTFSDYPDPDTVGGYDFILTSGVYGNSGSYHVDLLGRSVAFRPTYRLLTDLTYQVTVFSPLKSLQGCPARQELRTFSTGTGPADVPPAAPPPTLAADVLPIFAQSCGGAACHRQAPDAGGGCLAAPALALSLCDADAYAALVNVDASELSRLKRVAPGDSSRSYLLRKLLSPGPGGPPLPTTLGHRDPPGGALPDTQLRIISDWIDGGALPQ